MCTIGICTLPLVYEQDSEMEKCLTDFSAAMLSNLLMHCQCHSHCLPSLLLLLHLLVLLLQRDIVCSLSPFFTPQSIVVRGLAEGTKNAQHVLGACCGGLKSHAVLTSSKKHGRGCAVLLNRQRNCCFAILRQCLMQPEK